MTGSYRIVRIAVPTPLRRCFDYLAPDVGPPPKPGVRVRVPFGRREAMGVVLELPEHSDCPREKLKSTIHLLDNEPLLSAKLMELLRWAAGYYHHAIGEVMHTALPAALRRGQAATIAGTKVWRLTASGRGVDASALRRAPLQRRLLQALEGHAQGVVGEELASVSPGWRGGLGSLARKGWVECVEQPRRPFPVRLAGQTDSPPRLNAAQQAAVEAVTASLGRFQVQLLFGVTGSGKTEVYLHAVEEVTRQGRQALVLVPEISLTPQLAARFQRRLQIPVALLHSGLSDQERLHAWLTAREDTPLVILGTRSAVFVPLQRLGLIVVDEEHDQSYKQQDGFRYHGRDVAIMRASLEGIPVVLGSATPSLESLNRVKQGDYTLLPLPERTGSASLPEISLLDMRYLAVTDGVSPPLRQALQQRLDSGEQSLLFLNRRGFAPVYRCFSCGWLAPCERCDARLIVHPRRQRLRCHHCGADRPIPASCPECGGHDLRSLGAGTQRLEAALSRAFPQARLLRIDRDSTRLKGALEALLHRIHAGEADMLVGTQMLSKGHDFPDVTLVGVIDADQGLYSVDFRAAEHLFQQVMQVSGRAGRASKRGVVLVQTYYPDNPVFRALRHHDYMAFAEHALEERRQTDYPPFTHLALLRAESPQQPMAWQFIELAHGLAAQCVAGADVQIMEPVPAPMERRAGRYRVQLLVQAATRRALHPFLDRWLALLDGSRPGKRVRWSLDVDPMDLY